MKIIDIPKDKYLPFSVARSISCWLIHCVFLLPLAAQDTATPPDTLFQALRIDAEAAIQELDRFRLKSIALQMQEIAEDREREDLQHWAAFYLGDALMRENPLQARELVEEALAFFEARGDAFYIGRCYGLLGSVLTNINRSKEGIEHYKTAIRFLKQGARASNRAQTQRRITAMLSNIGLAYTRLSFFDLAADYLFQAEKIASQGTDTILLGAILNNLGNAFFLADRIEQSQEYYRKSYELAMERGHRPSLRMGAVGLGNSFFKLEQLDSALYYAQRSVDLLRGDNNFVSMCISLSNLASIYESMDQCTKADSISREVIRIATEKQLDRYRALAYFNLAECAQNQRSYDEAIRYANLSFEIVGGTGDLSFLKDIYELRYLAHQAKHNYQLALENHKNYKSLSDSILNENSLSKIEELQTRYDTEQKEREIEQLSETNRIQQLEYRQTLSWLVIGLIGLSLAGAVFFFYNRQRILLTNNQKLEAEQRLLRSQMNPHFIFNALSSIQTFLLSEGQAQKGAYYLTKFAKLIRRILEHSRVTFVPLSDELETLEHYLSLQQLRFEKQFDFQIDVDTLQDPEEIPFPPMLLQPAIENAIEHGDLAQVPNGKVTIEVQQYQDQLLRIRILDNGIGRKVAKNQQGGDKQHDSLATTIIRERIALLRKTYNRQIKYRIEDAPNGGTVVTYEFPLKPQS